MKSRVANFSRKKKGLYFWAFLAVGGNRLCMGCSGRSFAVEGSRRGKPAKSRVGKKKGLYFWAFLAVGRNRLCVGCSGRSFAVEGSRRGKPAKSRVGKKRDSTFGLFWLWEETGECVGCLWHVDFCVMKRHIFAVSSVKHSILLIAVFQLWTKSHQISGKKSFGWCRIE